MKGPLRALHRIALAAGVGHVATLLALIARPFDPPPVWYGVGGRAMADAARLALWRRREHKDPTLAIVEGWWNIAPTAKMSRPAAMRHARQAAHPLPVFGIGTDRVWAYVSAIEDWLEAERQPGWRHRRDDGAPSVPVHPPEPPPAPPRDPPPRIVRDRVMRRPAKPSLVRAAI